MSDALLHEANRRQRKVVEAVRVYVDVLEYGTVFEIQQAFNELKDRIEKLDEAEERMQKQATL